ncbi:MAG: DUF4331 domain-containing protein [Chitinophagaceae bacterium]|nr:DUF4331 domain-containing protein [Chitinophagaceae bacterium]
MKKKLNALGKVTVLLLVVGGLLYAGSNRDQLVASSHREAPLISDDPLADNTDLYCFRSPEDPNRIIIMANYIPLQLPMGGPNYSTFGEDINYEIHIKNDAATAGDDITYRFKFEAVNEDPTTFFNIRLGLQNIKTTYKCLKSVGGSPFVKIAEGPVPPNNIGPRSIEDPVVGLGTTYDQLISDAVTTADDGSLLYCGPADDPFFVDLGGIFDLGQTRQGGTGINAPRDGIAGRNVHVIAMSIPISKLQKDGKNVQQATSILDGDFVIGVWASASRKKVKTLDGVGGQTSTGKYVQISRLGMPLTNEAIIPIGKKDLWNWTTPYNDAQFEQYFTNPELALYMDDALFGTAVPGLSLLRIQKASQTVLGNVNFGNGNDGLFVIAGNAATIGTALDPAIFGGYLLRDNEPRSVDILPIFYTGVPNLAPYQLAVGKPDGNPLAPGKPFVNNFLPTFGDMLRLNMAVPVTPRDDPKFSSLGLIQAAVLGLTDPAYNGSTDLQFIPNMDGFPNGRRLEDDVTRIELQAVAGVALAAIGLWYDDHTIGIGQSPVTQDLLDVLTYSTGVESNDAPFKTSFPFAASPWSGYDYHYNYTY